MNKIFGKLKDFVGLNEISEPEDYDYIEEVVEDEEEKLPEKPAPKPPSKPEINFKLEQQEQQERPSRRRFREKPSINIGVETDMGPTPNRSNVIGMPGISQGISEVVVIEPHSFEEMPQVIQTLRERRSVVLNLNVMNPDEAQRAVDFVAGGTYALDGHQERIGESIFLFTPNCVKVSNISGSLSHSTEEEEEIHTPIEPNIKPNVRRNINRFAQ